MEIKDKIKKLEKLSAACNAMQQNISEEAARFMEFPYNEEVYCTILPGDGIMIGIEELYGDNAPHLVPIHTFFIIAKENGIVTLDDFKDNGI